MNHRAGISRSEPSQARRFGSLLPLEQVLTDLRASALPVAPRALPMGAAMGRVLAEPLRSGAPLPGEAIALRNGWAVAARDVIGASSYAPILSAEPPTWVEPGQVLPAGTDAILPPDGVTLHGGVAEIVASATPGEGVRRAGEDARSGAVLRAAGERVRASDMAVALAAGVASATVREARVRILSLPGPPCEATAELVARLSDGAGAAVERAPRPSRDRASIGQGLATTDADLILLIGGAGLGRDDHAADALAEAGSLIGHGIALRPGETTGCGIVGRMLVILVPRRLDAALAATLTLVLPCLDHLMAATSRLPSLSGRLTRKVASNIGMTEIVLLRRAGQGLEPLAIGDLTLTVIAGADAWLAVPADSEGYAAGETIAAFPL